MKLPATNSVNQLLVDSVKMQKFSKSFSNDLLSGTFLSNSAWDSKSNIFFRVSISEDPKTVELCGALKNIVACGAGFCDGLGLGDNTKAAIIRLGLVEMMSFSKLFLSDGEVKDSTFMESCGVADLITTCYGGRNRKVSEAFAKTGKPLAELEAEMLNGQKLQGPETARELQGVLKARGIAPTQFPLFTAVYNCCYEGAPVASFLKTLENHPAHN